MVKFNRRICEDCRVVFAPDIDEQIHCYKCLLRKKDEKIMEQYNKMCSNRRLRMHKLICINCNTKFKHRQKRRFCSEECCRELSTKSSPCKRKNKIEEANKKWLEGDKKKKKSLPLDVLIKQSEYKRVMDDRGWSHYLKGRKWDKI